MNLFPFRKIPSHAGPFCVDLKWYPEFCFGFPHPQKYGLILTAATVTVAQVKGQFKLCLLTHLIIVTQKEWKSSSSSFSVSIHALAKRCQLSPYKPYLTWTIEYQQGSSVKTISMAMSEIVNINTRSFTTHCASGVKWYPLHGP